MSPYSAQLAAAAELVPQPQSSGSVSGVATPGVVNRTAPNIQRPSSTFVFSQNPTEADIFRARVFAQALVPVGRAPAVGDNLAFAQALTAFVARVESEDLSAVLGFLEQNPQSAWRASLLLNIGLYYRKTGYFSRALTAWEEAWKLCKDDAAPNAKAVADCAVGELAELNARLGRYDRLEVIFKEIGNRSLGGPATEKVANAHEGLWLMYNRPESSFRCGPMALDRIRASAKAQEAFHPLIQGSRSTTNGISLVNVCALANALQMDFQMAKRQPGSEVIIPSVVHWQVGHYAALTKEHDGHYLVQDPTFGDDIWVSKAALDAETSGYCLIHKGALSPGWTEVGAEEGGRVWGKGNTGNSDPNRTTPCDKKAGCAGCGQQPMASYSIHVMLVSLNIFDTPVGYSPPLGPPVEFTVTYNQREYGQPSPFPYSNLGQKWTFNWLAYISDAPTTPLADASYYVAGGGTESYTGFDTNSSSYGAHKENGSKLVRTSATSYERRLPDGSKQVFDLPDGPTNSVSRKVFLTRLVDASSNAVVYSYNTNFCLVDVADAVDRHTTVSYDLVGDVRKITKVTDPFGRYATFDYNGSGQLAKITDVIGITSEFTYGANDFINSLKTPYGTTLFASGTNGTTRWLEATDPLGQKERVEYRDSAPGIADSDFPVPAGIATDNIFLTARNSFYWDKNSYQYTNDYTKAKIYHFLHTTDTTRTSGILESEKSPLEARVWRNYDGAPSYFNGNAVEGTNGLPSKVARVLDDGSTQISKFQYNDAKKITQFTDATNRITLYVYDTNLIDLLEVRQVVGATNELLRRLTYNSQHLPVSAVDAAGQTNRFGYSTNGLLLAVTNALGQTVTLAYNSDGYVTNVIGALPGATTSFSYDGTNRVRTITDSEGYTVTLGYDALDRPVQITYPDGTSEQIAYLFLDPVLRKDRRGHCTVTYYDPLRRVTDIQDSLNRMTHFEWCACGSLGSVTDPVGQVTTWAHDLQGRLTTKIYPDLSQVHYAYQTNSSRLRSVTDAKNQTTLYVYQVDNNLKQVSYSNAVVATPSVVFTYDTNYNRLLTMVDSIGTNSYTFYAVSNGILGAGRLQSVDGPLGNDTVTYSYDELGRISSRDINGAAETIAYDELGRATVITNVLGSFTNSYVDATFRLSTNFYANGQKTVLSYYGATNDFRLQQIQHLKPDASQLSSFSYTYDADGQIKTWTQQADMDTPKVLELQYDPMDQLLGATVHSNGIAGAVLKRYLYGYDKAGNRSSEQIDMGVTKASFNNLNQLTDTVGGGPIRFAGRLSEPGTVVVGTNAAIMGLQNTSFVASVQATLGTNVVSVVATDYSNNSQTNKYQIVVTNGGVARTLSYDLNGNQTSVITPTSTNTYEWDAADRLVAINIGQNRSEFSYDGRGRRVRIVEKANSVVQSDTRFLWCALDLCEERDSTGASTTKRFFGIGEQISGTNYYFSTDHLGSVRGMSDSAGILRARYDYDPQGRRTKISGNLEADYGFAGMHFHTASAMHLAVFRAYDADAGRWPSRDPIREWGGINLYGYVQNNPVQGIDPLGLDYLKNNTGVGVIVYGNPGTGHGTADYFVFGVQPPDGNYTGPIPGWKNIENARRQLDNDNMDKQCLQGPRQFVPAPDTDDGWIEDVDGYIDFNNVSHRLRGDDLGPQTTLSLNPNNEIVVSKNFLSVVGSYIRYVPRGLKLVGTYIYYHSPPPTANVLP